MEENNPYIIYLSGVIVVAIIDAIRIWCWYREDGCVEMSYGRIARNAFAILFSWLSCIGPIIIGAIAVLSYIVDGDFWDRKVTIIKPKRNWCKLGN